MEAKEKIIEAYIDRIQKKEIEFDQIRKELESKSTDSSLITSIVKEVDDILLTQLALTDSGSKSKKLLIFGVAATAIGATLTFGSFIGLFSTSNQVVVMIAYGPLIGGISLIFAALRRKSRIKKFQSERITYFKRRR
jgi:hypothetical protein